MLTNSRHFSWRAALSWSHWEQYLLDLIVWFSRRSSEELRGPANPTPYITSPLLEDQPLVWLVVVHFTCLMISSVPHFCTVSIFPAWCFKNGAFLLCLENHMWK